MSENREDTPATEDRGESHDTTLAELIEQVVNEHGDEGAAVMSDHLRNQTPETTAETEDPGDAED
jgi:hypothetical protein